MKRGGTWRLAVPLAGALLGVAPASCAQGAAGTADPAAAPPGSVDNEDTQGWTVPALRGVPLRPPARPAPARTPRTGPDAWEHDARGGAANEDTRGWQWPGGAGSRP